MRSMITAGGRSNVSGDASHTLYSIPAHWGSTSQRHDPIAICPPKLAGDALILSARRAGELTGVICESAYVSDRLPQGSKLGSGRWQRRALPNSPGTEPQLKIVFRSDDVGARGECLKCPVRADRCLPQRATQQRSYER